MSGNTSAEGRRRKLTALHTSICDGIGRTAVRRAAPVKAGIGQGRRDRSLGRPVLSGASSSKAGWQPCGVAVCPGVGAAGSSSRRRSHKVGRMLAKPIERSRTTEGNEEMADRPILDLSVSPVAKMIARGRERGYVTHDELNGALPPGETSADRIEDTMTLLSELGIAVTEGEESEAGVEEGRPESGFGRRCTQAWR